jgi:hypothetical protein
VTTLALGFDGTVMGPGTTGSIDARSLRGSLELSSIVQQNLVDIAIHFRTADGQYLLLAPGNPNVSSVKVDGVEGTSPGDVTFDNGHLFVARTSGPEDSKVTIKLEIVLKAGEVVRQTLVVDTESGVVDVPGPSGRAAGSGPRFDAMVASLLDAQRHHVSTIRAAFH